MSDYTSRANVILTMNGRQAEQWLTKLEKEAASLEKKISAAAHAGDKVKLQKLQRELANTRRQIDQLKGATNAVEQTLSRLDKATPKELNKALRQLQNQLNGIERGSKAWNEHAAKIQAVKAELQKVNATLVTQKSLWSRLNTWFNNAQTSIMAIGAAVAGLVMAGRKAVSSFADMQESLANTQKYTRMTADEVLQLNDIFKQMDTRLPREQLNLLAQEGGRLGYNTVQSVREYVEAASIINVALCDLGEGATQTIAKLSNIFGMEQMYGVRDAMLKVGSTVNHLSQNCTAAKPFLVEFAQRLAGVGATAKMTIPEIMAFAATLDAHGQKVEMSATALQRTIMELYKNTADMAKKVGLDARALTETLNKSTTEGVMMFLEALNKIGEKDALAVLSPLFQDLGFEGQRVSAVLSNLSSHLDFLKWQMGEASEAFRLGTSASGEFAIFNNTVQASIDKARKRVSELAVELGEKLYPIMKHIYTSSSMFLRVLNVMVEFFVKYHREIITASAALAAYNVVIAVYNARTVLAAKATALLNGTMNVLRGIIPVLRLGYVALCNAVLYLKNGLEVNYAMQVKWQAAMNAMKFTSWIGLITLLAGAIAYLSTRTDEYRKKLKEAVNTASAFSKELAEERRKLDELFGRLEACKKGSKEYADVKEEIVKQYGRYLKGLINERGEIVNLTEAYKRLAAAARIAAKERAIDTARKSSQEAYDDKFGNLAKDLQQSLIDSGKSVRDAARITNSVIIELQSSGTISESLKKELESIQGNFWDKKGYTKHPVNLVQKMIDATSEFKAAVDEISTIERETNPLASYTEEQLRSLIDSFTPKVNAGQGATIILGMGGPNPTTRKLNASEAADFLAEANARLSLLQSAPAPIVGGNPEFDIESFTPYETERQRRHREQEERAAAAAEQRRLTKEKREFKEALNVPKGEWESASTANLLAYAASTRSYTDYLNEKHRLDIKYFEDRMEVFKRFNLEEDEDYQALLLKKAEAETAWSKRHAQRKVEDAKVAQSAEETQAQMDFYSPSSSLYQNEEALQLKLVGIRTKYLTLMRDAYTKDSEEWYNYNVQLVQANANEELRVKQKLSQNIAEWKKQYEHLDAKKRLDMELELLNSAYEMKLLSEEQYQQAKADLAKEYKLKYLPDTLKQDQDSINGEAERMKRELDIVSELERQGILTHQEAEEAKDRISRAYEKKRLQRVRSVGSQEANHLLDVYEAWKSFFDKTGDDGENWATKLSRLMGGVFSYMNGLLQSSSEIIQANGDIELAAIEKRYDQEVEYAEGNSYRIQKAEKEKELAIANIKSDVRRKQFAMQLSMAIAQTAQNAISAYGAGLQVGGPAGLVFAPIASAMAIAAGALQIASISKQKQASDAQGYSRGGFTRRGRVDEPAGVVHAGEWVASQKLVNSPKARPIIDALEYAQRTNTIGSLSPDDVSRSITAPIVLASQRSASAPVVVQAPPASVIVQDNPRLEEIMNRLDARLNEPFVTVNTVAGDFGIQKAQDDYAALLRNKSPKSKR